jgi:ABC-type phosphate transport system substrate-binding protein
MRSLVFAIVVLLVSVSALAQEPAFRVIVHPDNPALGMSRDQVADVFLKKVTRWPDGETIRPVDLRTSSPVRKELTERVLRKSIAAVRSYWQQLIFSGRSIPPPELDSDAAVVAFVARNRGAIGYVSSEAKLDGVKVMATK